MMQISPWICRYYDLIPKEGQVLDVACGKGRHSLFLLDKGYSVVAVDIRTEAISANSGRPGLAIVTADLEKKAWPFPINAFSGIVVVNYLWRPAFPDMLHSLAPGGVLLYDTFALGNEKYGKPSNPEFLLKPGELKELCQGLEILHYEHGDVTDPHPATRQSIVARKQV